MSDRSALARWLPTLVGALVAVSVVMAYELGFVSADSEVAPSSAECPETTAEPGGDSLTAGARPHPANQRAALDAMALEDRVAVLEAQNAILAERAVTGELAFYGQTPAELEAMARHCDVRTDHPKNLDPQESEDLGLDEAERAAWQRALEAFAAGELEFYRGILREVAPDTPGLDELSISEVRRALTRAAPRSRAPGDDALRRHVAEERAGLRDQPADPSELSAWNRYNRRRYGAGDRFAELLGDELGDERVRELRSAFGGWPGARTRELGCEDAR